MKVAYLKNPDYLIYKNKIVIAVVCNKFSEEYKLYVVDGQHRIEMAKELFEKENINDYLTICYYKIKSDKSMKELFKEINSDSYKNNKYISLNDFTESLYDLTKEYLKSKYSIFFSEKKSSINRRYSLTEFLDILISKNYFENNNLDKIIEDIETKNKLFNKLIDYQEYWIQSPEIFYKDEQNCVKNGIIISLKNNNFIDYLINSENIIPDHMFKNQKKILVLN